MRRTTATLLSLVLLMGGLVFGVAGCKPSPTKDADKPGEGAPSASAQAPSEAGPKLLQPGQTAKYENLEITLLSLTRAAEYVKAPREGEEYAVLRFRIKNLGQEEESASIGGDLQWRGPDSDRRHGPESYTGVETIIPEGYRLAPGSEGEYEDVYMLPKDLTQVEFHYVPGLDPTEKARWMMSIK